VRNTWKAFLKEWFLETRQRGEVDVSVNLGEIFPADVIRIEPASDYLMASFVKPVTKGKIFFILSRRVTFSYFFD
jgi:hypothetical protein